MNNKAIICVDDEEMVLASLEDQLTFHLGDAYTIEVAESGPEALEIFAELTTAGVEVPLVISDHIMPGMKGDELLIQIHTRYPQTLKIMLTGQAEAEAVGKAVNQANLYRYIGKPWDKTDLNLTVSEAIRSYFQDKQLAEQNEALQKINQELSHLNATLEQKVAERTTELAQARDAAELASRAKSTFLATMSHELRTPLNAILGYTQILKRDLSAAERQQRQLTIIEQSGEHLLTLINDVLDLAKIEAGKTELDLTEFHLPTFLQNLVEIVRIRAQDKGLFCRYQPDEANGLPAQVYADEKRLRQILINLLGNAVKFTDEGGVTFSVGVRGQGFGFRGETLEIRRKGDNSFENLQQPLTPILRFEIEDTGLGIAPEHLQAIFDPFQQVGDQQHRSGGTGLGLAISRNLLELMDSELHVISELGLGSTFWFEVPLATTAASITIEPVVNRQIVGIKGQPPKILVVDDKWVNRAVVVDLLAPLGFEMLEADNGREALAKALAEPPQVIITDLVMPKLDGFELIRQLRQSTLSPELLIIAVSASVLEVDEQNSLAFGADVFLRKPLKTDRLFEILAQHLHLEWVYQAQDDHIHVEQMPTSSSLPLTPPASAKIMTLLNFAKMGDVEAVTAEAKQLLEADETLKPFVDTLQELVQRYQIQKMCDWLKSYLNE